VRIGQDKKHKAFSSLQVDTHGWWGGKSSWGMEDETFSIRLIKMSLTVQSESLSTRVCIYICTYRHDGDVTTIQEFIIITKVNLNFSEVTLLCGLHTMVGQWGYIGQSCYVLSSAYYPTGYADYFLASIFIFTHEVSLYEQISF